MISYPGYPTSSFVVKVRQIKVIKSKESVC